MRARYTDWPRDSTIDQSAQDAYDSARGADRTPVQRANAAHVAGRCSVGTGGTPSWLVAIR